MTYNLYVGDAWIDVPPDEYGQGGSRQSSSRYIILAGTAEEAGDKLLAELLDITGHTWHGPHITELTRGAELDIEMRIRILEEVFDVIR